MNLKRLLNDESGQVLRYVLKFGIAAVIVIFLLAEVGPIVWMRIFLPEEAEEIANIAALDIKMRNSEETARGEVANKMQMMHFSDDEIRESVVEFLPPGSGAPTSVKVTVVKYAKTLLTRHIGFLNKLSRIAATKEVSMSEAAGNK